MRCRKYTLLLMCLLGARFLTGQDDYSKRYLRQIAAAKPASKYDSLMVSGATYGVHDTIKAFVCFKNALDIAIQEADLQKRVLTNIAIGDLFLLHDSPRKAYNYFFRARNLMEGILPTYEGGLASFGIARAQYSGGNYRTSILNFLATVHAGRETKNAHLEAESVEYLGLIYSNFQDYSESIRYYRRCYDLKKSLDDDKSCLRIAEKLGDIYYFNRRFDSAYYYANLSIQFAETLQLSNAIPLTRLNKAAALIRLKKLGNAFDELRQAF